MSLQQLQNNVHLLMAKVSAPTSIGALIISYLNRSNITWSIGIVVGLFSIYASWTSTRKDKALLRKTEEELNQLKRESHIQ
jgi:hypothetical protein